MTESMITGHVICDMLHLNITDGAAILFNQEIHEVRMTIARC